MTGQILHFFTKEPQPAHVSLRGDNMNDNSEYTEGTIEILGGNTSENGTFSFQGKASRRNNYSLYVKLNEKPEELVFYKVSVPAGSIKNFGEILLGKQDFFCKVNVISVSSNTITFFGKETKIFKPGSIGTYLYSAEYTNAQYTEYGHNLRVAYSLRSGTVTTNSFVAVPISGFDTLRSTVYN